jgi:glycosyltransferase involved in cell wall biosynthesis
MEHPLRILRVAQVPHNRSGGMSRTMFCTGDELERMGHRVEYCLEEDLAVKASPQLWRFITPWKILRHLRTAARRGTTWDIVEIHEPLGALCALRRGALPPLVAFSYGLEERSHQATIDYRRRHGRPVSLKFRFSPLTVIWQAKYFVRHAAHVLCSNATDVEHLVAAGVPRGRLTRHFSGVESVFLEKEPPPADRRRGLLFLGTWMDRKGASELATAGTELLRRHPDLTFTLAGTVRPAGEILPNFAADVRGRIEVIPRIQGNERLIEIYGRHAVFVLPSYFEGHPLVMIEAAAQGLPIVGTDIGGIRDFVVSGENGFLVPVADAPALSCVLEKLLTDSGLRARCGAANRLKAREFTWAAAAANILRGYEQAIADRRRTVA